jgi:hypothetical protein
LSIAYSEYSPGNVQNAIANCSQALALNPLFSEALVLRGFAYVKLEEYQ